MEFMPLNGDVCKTVRLSQIVFLSTVCMIIDNQQLSLPYFIPQDPDHADVIVSFVYHPVYGAELDLCLGICLLTIRKRPNIMLGYKELPVTSAIGQGYDVVAIGDGDDSYTFVW